MSEAMGTLAATEIPPRIVRNAGRLFFDVLFFDGARGCRIWEGSGHVPRPGSEARAIRSCRSAVTRAACPRAGKKGAETIRAIHSFFRG